MTRRLEYFSWLVPEHCGSLCEEIHNAWWSKPMTALSALWFLSYENVGQDFPPRKTLIPTLTFESLWAYINFMKRVTKRLRYGTLVSRYNIYNFLQIPETDILVQNHNRLFNKFIWNAFANIITDKKARVMLNAEIPPDTRTYTQTQTMAIPEVQNWPAVKKKTFSWNHSSKTHD